MGALTISLFPTGYGFRGRQGRINRFEGAALLLVYVGYTAWLLSTVVVVKTRVVKHTVGYSGGNRTHVRSLFRENVEN